MSHSVRLGLDFKATAWVDSAAERTQVECHMRLCLAATESFYNMVTISPSEPLLAEASWTVMKRSLGPIAAPRALLCHINESYLNAGDRGEVVAALLLLLARDKAIQDHSTPNPGGEPPNGKSPLNFKYDGVTKGRIVTVPEFLDALVPPNSPVGGRMPTCYSSNHSPSTPLASAFGKGHIYFNDFIKVHNFQMVNRDNLCRLFCHGAAIICANNQHGIDILIPVLMGIILRPEFMSGSFFQIKNDGSFTDNVDIALFTLMNPFHVGLFSKADENLPALPPVLRIVLALASKKSGVTGPQIRVRRSTRLKSKKKKTEFTAYDIWIAGVSSQSFGVIPDEETHVQYRLLLDRTRNVFNNYGALTKGKFENEEQSHIDARRMMHAGAAPGEQHHQNYISNLTTAPRTSAYVVDDYIDIEGSVGIDMDQGEPDLGYEGGPMDVDVPEV